MRNKLGAVFYVSLGIAVIFIGWGVIAPGHVEMVLGAIQGFISNNLGWFYLLATTAFVLFSLFLIFGPYGKIRLGKPDEKPEYSYFTWFAFLFTAGMGVGLVFWGVAEPLYHYYSPPSATPETGASAEESLQFVLFHWGIHPWATYAIVALTLAYFKFRHEAPALISSAFTPLLGERTNGSWGHSIDILAVFATIFGIATSLGLGAAQITAGLSYSIGGMENNTATQLIVIFLVTVLFILSASTGIDRGIRYLSWSNIVLAVALMIFVFILGPTVQIMNGFTTTLGNYLQNLPSMTFGMNAFTGERSFLDDWTIFYWAWWIGWSPFVGTFIARVSRGRTIREFVTGVLAIPVLFSAIWFAVFGMTSIDMNIESGGALFQLMTEQGDEIALFAFLENLPLSGIVVWVAVLLISSFFITSADSATFVLGMLTTGGKLNPSLNIKIVWGLVLAGTAAVLLLSGGLSALEMAMIIAAFPFTFVMLAMGVSLIKVLSSEYEILVLERKQRDYDPDYQEKSLRTLEQKREEFEKTVLSEDED